MIFLSAFKSIAVALLSFTLAGYAISISILFSTYINGLTKNPFQDNKMFNSLMMGFSLIETYLFFTFIFLMLILIYL